MANKKILEDKAKNTIPVRLLIVGDGTVGKTSLLLAYMKDVFYENYEPTIYETAVKDVTLDKYPNYVFALTAEDTAGQEDYDQFRLLQYSNAAIDVILLCFSVDNADSLINAKERWFEELRYYCPGIPIILIGTKSDLRNETPINSQHSIESRELVPGEDAENVKLYIGANSYVECSAKTRNNVNEVFEITLSTVVARKFTKPKKNMCCFQ